jgi:hypothetical protein
MGRRGTGEQSYVTSQLMFVEVLAIFSWWECKHGSNDGRGRNTNFIIKKASCLRHQYVLDFSGGGQL